MHLLGDPTGLQTRRFQWGFIRRVGGYIPVNNREGSGPTLYHHVDRCPRRGGVVVLFPEGRSRLQALLPEYRDPRGPRLLRDWLTNLF